MARAAAVKKPARTISVISDEVWAIKCKVTALNKQVDDLKREQAALEHELYEKAMEQGLEKGGGKTSTFSIAASTVPQVNNWDDFYDYIHTNKYYHLLQRRPSVEGCRELWRGNVYIPGVDQYTQSKITVRGTD